MNRLTPDHLNGFSNAIDNLYMLESLINDNIKALVRHIGVTNKADGFKITGATTAPSGSDQSVASGWIWLQGEILEVEAHVAAGPLGGGESWYWAVSESNLSSSQDEDVDGNTIYTVKRRKAILTRGTTPGDYMPKDAPYMVDVIREADTTAWATLTKPHAAVTGTVEYRKRHGNLELRGVWYVTGQTLSQVTLPVGHRPEQSMIFYNVQSSTVSGPDFADVKGCSTSFIKTTNVLDFVGCDGLNVNISFEMIPPIPIYD